MRMLSSIIFCLLLVSGCDNSKERDAFSAKAKEAIRQTDRLVGEFRFDEALAIIEPLYAESSDVPNSAASPDDREAIRVCIQNVDGKKRDYEQKMKEGYKVVGDHLVSPTEQRESKDRQEKQRLARLEKRREAEEEQKRKREAFATKTEERKELLVNLIASDVFRQVNPTEIIVGAGFWSANLSQRESFVEVAYELFYESEDGSIVATEIILRNAMGRKIGTYSAVRIFGAKLQLD